MRHSDVIFAMSFLQRHFWNSPKLWRNIVFGAILAKVFTKLIGAGMQYVIQKYIDVPPAEVKHEKDVVYLYMFPRNMGKSVPNISPFGIKVEMWLRIHNIKHHVSSKDCGYHWRI